MNHILSRTATLLVSLFLSAAILILDTTFFEQSNTTIQTGQALASFQYGNKSMVIPMDKLEAILETAENNFSDVQTLKARLIQEKNISLFSEPVISEGLFLFKNPDKIRLEFTTPFKSALLVNKDQIYRFEKIKGEWKAMRSGDKKITRIMLEHMAAWVKGRFNKDGLYRISGRYISGSKSETPAAIILILEPKAEEFRKFIRAFELGINSDINRLEHITIRESEQDFTHIEFYDEQINMPIENNLFAPGKQGPVPVLW